MYKSTRRSSENRQDDIVVVNSGEDKYSGLRKTLRDRMEKGESTFSYGDYFHFYMVDISMSMYLYTDG